MPSQHHHKIYLDQEYPCPCHLNGKLQQIVLTDAFGCDRCRRIFVIRSDGYTIEELATTYPYKHCYAWTGTRWQILRFFPVNNLGEFLRSRDLWVLWIQCLGLIALTLAVLRLYYRLTATSPILNLVLSMAIAIAIFVAIAIWLFSQG